MPGKTTNDGPLEGPMEEDIEEIIDEADEDQWPDEFLPPKTTKKEVKEETFAVWPTQECLASYELLKRDLDQAKPDEVKEDLLYLTLEFSHTYHDFSDIFDRLGLKVEILCHYIDGEPTGDHRIVVTPKSGDKKGMWARWHLERCGFDCPIGGSSEIDSILEEI